MTVAADAAVRPRIKPGMTMRQARAVLPGAIADLGLTTPNHR
jgi:hypothetical protein